MPKVPGGARIYAVAKGHHPGLYYTWEECEDQVKGFPGAKHKKVRTLEEATEWLATNGVALPKDGHASPSAAWTAQAPVATGRTPKSSHQQSTSTSSAAHLGPTSRPEPRAATATAGASCVQTRVVNTDGACKGNGKDDSVAGVGVYWGAGDSRNIAERCPGAQTNNRAELIAIIRALETVPIDDAPLLIRTDSQYSMNCVEKWLKQWRITKFRTTNGQPVKNKALICYMDARLTERRQAGQKVTFEYVRGHTGDVGNEGADHQANMGCSLPLGPEPDWEMLEADTRTRIAETKYATDIADQEALLEALSDDVPIVDPVRSPNLRPQSSNPVGTRMVTPPRTLPSPQKQKSPFKPAKLDTPQFKSPTSSPQRPAAAAAAQLTEEDLESYADCLVGADQLEAELADS